MAAANIAFAGKNAMDAIKAGQGQTITDANGTIREGQIVTKTNPDGSVAESHDATAADKSGGINLSISIGSSSSQSKTTQTSDSARESTVAAGNNLNITASGAGQDSDITAQGSSLQAGNRIALNAQDEIRLLAAKNTAEQHSTNASKSGSVGISIGTNGLLFTVSASGARGNADGSDVTWTNTHVNAGNQVTLQSAGDTTMKGAVISGKQVTANIGGDLNIESLQDTSQYDSKQQSIGGSISIGYGKVGGSFSASKSKVDSNFASVTEQSGIKAGDGGFNVNVQGDTDLRGGAITSTQKAIDDNKNSFSTGAELTTSDIQNQASYKASSVGVSIGTGGKLAPQGSSAGIGKDSGNASSTTQAAISGVAGNKDARTGDAETGIAKIFDADKVQKDINAQVQITQTFGQQAAQAWGGHANNKFAEALKRDDEEGMRCWGPDGACRAYGHAVLGGLAGGVGSAAGAGISSLAAPHIQAYLLDQGVPPAAASAVTQLAAIGAGSTLGGSAGAAGALNETGNNAVIALPLLVDGVVAGGAVAARACLSSPSCLNALRLGGTAVVAKVASLLSSEDLAKIPGFGAGSHPPSNGPLETPIPDPAEMQRLHGVPPLENQDVLRSWLANTLEGYPANEAEKWAKGFITTLPAAQQATWQDFILQAVQDNAISGSQRERQVTADLQAQYPGGSVQNQQYLRDRDGNIVIDPNTGTARRLDHVVVVDGKIVDVVETTSLTAEKEKQIRHERETRKAGGAYIRDRETGNLIEIPSISRIERRP